MKPRKQTIFVDLDGVLADFDGRYEELFGARPDWPKGTFERSQVWQNIWGIPDFFAKLPFTYGGRKFWMDYRHLQPVVLTACSHNHYEECATQKREWVRHHLGATTVMLPAISGETKYLFMHAPGDILIDDTRKNIEAWTAAGGIGILHAHDWDTTRAALEHHLARQPGMLNRWMNG